jgi:IrrE N-terminal-like domain
MHTSPHFPADTPRSYASIERDAARARLALGFGLSEPIAARECMRRLRGIEAIARKERLPIVYAVTKLGPGVEGETSFDRERRRLEIALSEKTYSRLTDWRPEDGRARFSFFHEFGHANLHCNELIRLARIPKVNAEAFMRATFAEVEGCRDVEWQANAFSSAIMMPAIALEQLRLESRLRMEEVCRVFQVSRTSAEIRIGVFRSRRRDLLVEV